MCDSVCGNVFGDGLFGVGGAAAAVVHELAVDFVGDDDAVVHGSEPAGHDDADAAGVVEAGNLLGEGAADGEALELGAKACAGGVVGVMLKTARG